MQSNNELLSAIGDAFTGIFPLLNVQEVLRFRATSRAAHGLFSNVNVQAHIQRRIEERFGAEVAPDNLLVKLSVFCLFDQCMRVIPPKKVVLRAQKAKAAEWFQLLEEKINSFEKHDPFFLSWGNYFLGCMYLCGYGIGDSDEKEATRFNATCFAKAKEHLVAAAANDNPKAMLLFAGVNLMQTTGFSFVVGVDAAHPARSLGEIGIVKPVDVFQMLRLFALPEWRHLEGEPEQLKALAWLEKAFNLKNREALGLVAQLYAHKLPAFSCQSDEAYAAIVKMGKEKGDANCATLMAQQRMKRFNEAAASGKTDLVEYAEVIKEFERAAQLGSESAAEFLLEMHQGDQPPEIARLLPSKLRCLEAHAKINLSSARDMAELYSKGNIHFAIAFKDRVEVEVDVKKAVEWYKYAISTFANKGYGIEVFYFERLMQLYLNPTLGSFDPEKAVACGEEGMRWGYADPCAVYLGILYFVGCEAKNVSVDKSKADYYFSRAQNDEPSLLLSDYSVDGLPIELYREAIRWKFIELRRHLSDPNREIRLKGDFSRIIESSKIEKWISATWPFRYDIEATTINAENIDTFLFPKLNQMLTNIGMRPFDASELVYEESLRVTPQMLHRGGVQR